MCAKWLVKLKGMRINKRLFLSWGLYRIIVIVCMALLLRRISLGDRPFCKVLQCLTGYRRVVDDFCDKISCCLTDYQIAFRWQCFPKPQITQGSGKSCCTANGKTPNRCCTLMFSLFAINSLTISLPSFSSS